MKSRTELGILIAVLILLVILGILMIKLVPAIRDWSNPVEEAITTIEEVIDERVNPTPTIRPNPATIIHEINSLSRLETASYTIEKVITAESGQDALAFLFGDRLLFVAHGQVIAGIDLALLEEADIIITENDQVMLTLPPAEVFVVTLDNDKSFVYDRETGLLGLNETLETAARQAAEQEILNAALEDGILEKADANARIYLQGLISAFGFQEVIFIEVTPTLSPPTLSVTIVPTTPVPH